MSKKRIFSGIRATGNLHLGNYLGAVKGMLDFQDNPDYDMLFSVVDMHAMTTPFDKETLAAKTRSVVLDYLSAGMDPEKSILVVQSMVGDLHAELMFYFSTQVTVAKMQHLPTYKEKAMQHKENVTMALLNYPVLMSADILAYKGELVPVGIDQEPHLEVARDIARKMNASFGMDFPEPQRFATTGEYVPSLKGVGKMGKSVEGSFINLIDDLETIKKRLASAPTDSGQGEIKDEQVEMQMQTKMVRKYYANGQESVGVKSLMEFVELFQGKEARAAYEAAYTGSGIRYGDLKASLAEAIYAELEPIQAKRAELEANASYVDDVVYEGAKKAREIATQTLEEVKEKMGLR